MSIKSPRSSAERRIPQPPAVVLLALVLIGLGASRAVRPAAAAPAEMRERALQAMRDARYQRQLPARSSSDDLQRAPSRPPALGRMPRLSLPLLGLGVTLAQVAFVVLLGAALISLAIWLASEVARRKARTRRAEIGVGDLAASPGDGSTPTADEAARLAGEGRYGEAVHALLLAAIGQLATRARRALQPHLTSRELVRALPLGPDSQAAFRDLVAAVERSLFGGSAVEEEEYESCRERYQRLTGGGAA
jgi:hypothetical protein